MPRTTDNEVRTIIETDAAIDLEAFILTANLIVTDCCSGFSYSEEKLELIERWLAAHFYAVRDVRVKSEGAGDVSQSFDTRVDLYLASTMYGQQAMLLDFRGGLAALNKTQADGTQKKPRLDFAFFHAEGTPE